MHHAKRPRASIIALLLMGCSGSGEEESNNPAYEQQGFISPEEAANAAQRPGDTSSDDVELNVPEVPPAGESGSGVIVVEDEGDAWLIPNDGASFAGPPLQVGEGPSNANTCPDQDLIVTATESVGDEICFFSEQDPETPAARINQVIEVVDGEEFVRIRLTLNPNFVDNSYGETSVGWGTDAMAEAGETTPPEDKPKMKPKPAKGHTFKDLVGSDHAEIKLTDASGDLVMHFKVDYLSENADAASGYASSGVSGGDGAMIVGEADWVLQATTSMDRNLNACGYSGFTENSPAAPTLDEPSEAEDWDYRVVYEVWISLEAFGDAGFGEAFIDFVHASPSKASSSTVEVTSGPCPPDDDPPPGGSGGAPGSAGSPGTAGGGSSSGGSPSAPSGFEEAR